MTHQIPMSDWRDRGHPQCLCCGRPRGRNIRYCTQCLTKKITIRARHHRRPHRYADLRRSPAERQLFGAALASMVLMLVLICAVGFQLFMMF